MIRFAPFVILGLMIAMPSSGQESSGKEKQEKSETPKVQQISTDELEKLLERKENLFLLDVREPKEIEELGTVEGYVNIPLGQLESRLSEVPKNKLIVTL
jgi:hypothetical protein